MPLKSDNIQDGKFRSQIKMYIFYFVEPICFFNCLLMWRRLPWIIIVLNTDKKCDGMEGEKDTIPQRRTENCFILSLLLKKKQPLKPQCNKHSFKI